MNNFTDHPYKLKKGLHNAIFSVMTPEQMKYVKPVDTISTWHLLQNDQEQAAHYVSSLIKTNKITQISENYLFLTPENPGTPRNTRPSKKEFCVNYTPYRTWRPLILPKTKTLGQNSRQTMTGRIQHLHLKKYRESKNY